MDSSALSGPLREQLLEFAWDEWAQMGLLAHTDRVSPWAADPEALILLTLEVARSDPRLFDELLDWMLTNEPLLSVRRLRALCIDEHDVALLDGAVAWLASQRPRPRLKAPGAHNGKGKLEPLFRGQPPPVRSLDGSFAAAGLERPVLRASGNSRPPDPAQAINLAFRLRQILGVGIRAEVIRILITTEAPWVSAQALARSSGYSKRNVHDALTGLANADVITAHSVGGEQRYTAKLPAWADLLGGTAATLPSHRDWPQLFGALRVILRWLTDPATSALSQYMLASSARDLLERVRPTLAFAGIATNIGTAPEASWDSLETVIEDILGQLRREA
jgi:hypothetical protein